MVMIQVYRVEAANISGQPRGRDVDVDPFEYRPYGNYKEETHVRPSCCPAILFLAHVEAGDVPECAAVLSTMIQRRFAVGNLLECFPGRGNNL